MKKVWGKELFQILELNKSKIFLYLQYGALLLLFVQQILQQTADLWCKTQNNWADVSGTLS